MEHGLDIYNKKRDFNQTQEPRAESGQKTEGDRLRFVVQRHIATRDHYDFRLEWEGELLSWAVPKGPSYNPGDKRLAVRVENHPLDYRHFEGTIPKGQYGGGTVMIWDEGFWEPEHKDVNQGLKKGVLKFTLKGQRLKGKWVIFRIEGDEGKDNWLLMKEQDEYVLDDDGISHYQTSAVSGRTLEEIERDSNKPKTNPFERADFMLAKFTTQVPEGKDWFFEVKYDGFRILAFIEGGKARLISRNQNNLSQKFNKIARSLENWAGNRAMVLDGEVVITDERGKTDFQALQNFMKRSGSADLSYIVFDILALDGEDLRQRPLKERKDILEQVLAGAPEDIVLSKYIIGNGKACWNAACKQQLEGIVGKKASSTYTGNRSSDWIKLKCRQSQVFVVGGYTRSAKKTSGISSLLLGYFEDGKLVFAGRAGTGFSDADREHLEKLFSKSAVKASPFTGEQKGKSDEKIFYIKPQYFAEVEFAEWTNEKLLRQASFIRLATKEEYEEKEGKANIINEEQIVIEAKAPSKVTQKKEKVKSPIEVIEKPKTDKTKGGTVLGVKISNPDKVLYTNPALTKLDIAAYYEAVAERMLIYTANRLLSVIRCPKGAGGACYFKKHPDTQKAGVKVLNISKNSGEKEEYFYIDSAQGLVSEAQMGALEFHIWGSKVDTLEKPDMMVFDLDPDEGMDIAKVRRGVKDLKQILEDLGLESFLKTSGGKGYHIVVPFAPSAGWERFYSFSKKVAEAMEQNWPDRYTTNSRKIQRKGRIFIDWQRNGRGATSVAPYSLRAREGATVSMPLSWDELDKVAPNNIDIFEALKRIKQKDPWESFTSCKQKLKG